MQELRLRVLDPAQWRSISAGLPPRAHCAAAVCAARHFDARYTTVAEEEVHQYGIHDAGDEAADTTEAVDAALGGRHCGPVCVNGAGAGGVRKTERRRGGRRGEGRR